MFCLGVKMKERRRVRKRKDRQVGWGLEEWQVEEGSREERRSALLLYTQIDGDRTWFASESGPVRRGGSGKEDISVVASCIAELSPNISNQRAI